jgi:hypothetical protein
LIIIQYEHINFETFNMSIKIFSLFLFACSASILGMEKETLKKDPLLLCELPKELLGNIVRRATHDETFKSIKYLIRNIFTMQK